MPDTGILIDPLEVGGSTARVIEGTSESLPYTMKFIDPDGTILPGWFDANGVLQVLGRVVEIVLAEDGVPHTADVRRVGSVRASDPPILELHLIDEAAFDRTTLFELNPTIQAVPPGPVADWANVDMITGGSPPFQRTTSVVGFNGDFRWIDTGGGTSEATRMPQYNVITGDVVDAPVGPNGLGNFRNLTCAISGVDRPVTSFGLLTASTAEAVLNADDWIVTTSPPMLRSPPPFWVYWPGGPTSGSVTWRLHFGTPGVATTSEMPYLIETDGIRTLLARIMDGTYGGGAMRFQLPSTNDLPNDLLGGSISLAVPGPMLRRDLLAQIAKVAGLVLWFDALGRLAPRPWPVPPIGSFTQVDLDAMYRFDGTTAITPPTYEVKHSQAFNVWQTRGFASLDLGVVAARPASPFWKHVMVETTVEEDETAVSPITPDRQVHGTGMASLLVDAAKLTGPGSVAEAFVNATLGGLAEGRITGHATLDAPDPGDLVIFDHDDLKGVNPATGARSGLQLARIVDKRRVYSSDEVAFEYRVVFGGKA